MSMPIGLYSNSNHKIWTLIKN